jgi:hypothetical protein
LEIELKNIILRRVSIFEFLHSQGQSRRFGRGPAEALGMSQRGPETDTLAAARSFIRSFRRGAATLPALALAERDPLDWAVLQRQPRLAAAT